MGKHTERHPEDASFLPLRGAPSPSAHASLGCAEVDTTARRDCRPRGATARGIRRPQLRPSSRTERRGGGSGPRLAQRCLGENREEDPCWKAAGRSALGASLQLHPGTVHARGRDIGRSSRRAGGGKTSERVRMWACGRAYTWLWFWSSGRKEPAVARSGRSSPSKEDWDEDEGELMPGE